MAPVSSIILSTGILFAQVQAAYLLDTNIAGTSFFSNWNFQTSTDPSGGFVTYVSQSAAQSAGLLFAQDGTRARISADSKTTLTPAGPGRKSVHIQSKKSWTHGLFIHDIVALPTSACGSWPALWLLGPNWPTNGEIDIVEGVNSQTKNIMSLHTKAGCTFNAQTQLGTLNSGQCDGTKNGNEGCGFTASSTATYGNGFNANGGGVYATEWTKNYIKIWEFARSAIPQDIKSGKPVPSGWGTPQAYFKGGSNCVIDSHFQSLSLVLNLDFCGDWAGNVWSTDPVCKNKATDCKTYVAKNPQAFTGTQFLINSIKVYKDNAATKRSQGTASEYEDGTVEEREVQVESLPVSLAPEVAEREAAHDAYMRGDEMPLLDILEKNANREVIHVRSYPGNSHLHRHVHRSMRVGA